MGKKGWIRIVEAMTAILLIAAVVVIAINQNQRLDQNTSQRIYAVEQNTLNEIQLNDSARAEILSIPSSSLPVAWDSFSSLAPNTKEIVMQNYPSSMQCQGRICSTSDPCILGYQNTPSKTIYAQDVVITANLTLYNPRLMKIFCW